LRSGGGRGILAAPIEGESLANMFRRRFIPVLLLALCAPFAAVAADSSDGGKKDAPADAIVITGASGGLAGETIDALLARNVSPDRLILVTRTPEKLSFLAERGAQIRHGDFTKPDGLPAAFAGGKQMLLISTNGGDRVAQHTAAIDAARRAGIRHIVYTSWVNAVPENPAAVTRDHRLTEEALRKSGIPYTILRNQLYAEGLIEKGRRAVASGILLSNSGRGVWAPVSRRDCATAAAVVLTTPGHEGQTYEITGPDLISEHDFAAMLTQVTGKPVRVVDMNDATYIEMLVKSGMSPEAAKAAASFGIATRMSAINIKSDALEILLGHPPQSVHDLLVHNKAQLLVPVSAGGR
jgi:NAD(P)H dehydrogenase (quinone)